MAEIVSQEGNLDCLLFVCLYCENYRTDNLFWEQASDFFLTSQESTEDEDVCPECLCERVPDGCLSCREEGGEGKKEGEVRDKGNAAMSFLVVTNKGCLIGDYDREQRL